MLPVIDVGAAARWALDKAERALEIANAVRERLIKNSPSLEDGVVVEIVGQPGSSKQQLYLLALATANGIVRRRADLTAFDPFSAPRFGLLKIDYDAASNWVRCTLQYKIGLFGLSAGGPSSPGSTIRYDQLAVYNGPQCDVVGMPMNFVSDVLPGIPKSSVSSGVPKLPFVGKTILTTCPTVRNPAPTVENNPPPDSGPLTGPTDQIPTPNPKPPGDNRSRGRAIDVATGPAGSIIPPYTKGQPQLDNCCPMALNLVQLVMTALTDPGSEGSIMFNPPIQGPTGG